MGTYAKAHLIYGFVHDDDTADLFDAIVAAEPDDNLTFDESHEDLQEKHKVSLSSVGYDGIDILSACSAKVACRGFGSIPLDCSDLANTTEYHQKIRAFLQELGINPDEYIPGWHLLSYMD
jgi:hypothetical protein